MPIEILDSNNQSSGSSSTVYPEIISQHQRFILGAKLEHADFQFISVSDTEAFSTLPEGTFFTDVDEDGLNRVGRKIAGQRKYLAYEQELKAYVVDEIAKLKPIAVNPVVEPLLPLSSGNRPLFAGQQIVFLIAGTVAGRQVEAGGVATVTKNIPVGIRAIWDDLIYNGTGIQVSSVVFKDSIRLDGSAGGDGASEKAVADAINATASNFNTAINQVDQRLTGQVGNLVNRTVQIELANNVIESDIASVETNLASHQAAIEVLQGTSQSQTSRLNDLEANPYWGEENIVIGDGTSQLFKLPLLNNYQNTPILVWEMLMGNGYTRINAQDGDIVSESINGNTSQFLSAAFAGIPATAQFRVSVQGLVLPMTSVTVN